MIIHTMKVCYSHLEAELKITVHCTHTFLIATVEAELKVTVHCILTFLIATLGD